MNWHDILKLKKYGEKDIKLLFEHKISSQKSTGNLIPALFNLIYFNIPLSGKARIELRRLASTTTNVELSVFLSNFSTAGGKIIETDRILPFDRKEMKTKSISIYNTGNLYEEGMVIYTIDFTIDPFNEEKLIKRHSLEILDGLYHYKLYKNVTLGENTIDIERDFIKKIVDYFNDRKEDYFLKVTFVPPHHLRRSGNKHMYEPSFEVIIDWLQNDESWKR